MFSSVRTPLAAAPELPAGARPCLRVAAMAPAVPTTRQASRPLGFAAALPLSASRASSVAPSTTRRRPRVVACAPAPAGGPPAAVLLGASSVLAISTIGCIFELSSGHPQYGTAPTAAILIGSAPGFVALFAAAIKKGQAEAEEE